MQGVIDLPEELRPVADLVAARLLDVSTRFDAQLESDLPPVNQLCKHIERYRGKMLRPTLVLLCGAAAHPKAGGAELAVLVTDDHATLGAVCEMVHMATLVHDDVLDEAETRRRGDTVNRLRGNETAVILGDYLIASAYHLCSGLGSQRYALAIGRASAVMCAGELLQLHHRGDYSLDEPTYFEIVERKTAELIAAACEMGAVCSGADEEHTRQLRRYGLSLGVAFQIQDDVLDLTGEERIVGKSVGKDVEKGKMTLPLIHHLATADDDRRAKTLSLLERAAEGGEAGAEAGRLIAHAVEATHSVDHARAVAQRLVGEAREALATLPVSPARDMLDAMAVAVVNRAF